MQGLIERLIDATNAFDIDAAMTLFAADAVIADVSVGDSFAGTARVRSYLEQFFVGYETASQVLSIELLDERHAIAHLDFTGSFGHETGILDISTNADGLITRINADLD